MFKTSEELPIILEGINFRDHFSADMIEGMFFI